MKTIVKLVSELKDYLLGKDTAAKQAVESNIAPVEADASSASQAYVVGAQLILNDVLYDVTSSISVGDAIAVGTNIAAASKLSVNIKSKQDQIEVTTMPTASASNVGKVLIYIGATTSTYTSGQSYQSTLEGGNYVWKPTSISSVDASGVHYDNQTSGLMATDAQGAIDEVSDEIGDLTDLDTNVKTDLVSAVNEVKASAGGALYFSGQACSALTGNFCTISNANITANHVVAEAVFANPSAITTDVTWTTANGSLVLNGTCSTATTVNIVLVKKNN